MAKHTLLYCMFLMSEFVVRSTTHLLKWLHTLWLLKTISNSGHENYPYKWGQPDFSNFEKFTFVTWSPIDHELVLKWSSKGQNLKVSSTVISAMFTFKVLEIETFFSHDSTALVCLIIVDILLFSIMMWPMNCCFTGKKYCYGSMQGEYCHCDYCKCKHGYGAKGYGHCH